MAEKEVSKHQAAVEPEASQAKLISVKAGSKAKSFPKRPSKRRMDGSGKASVVTQDVQPRKKQSERPRGNVGKVAPPSTRPDDFFVYLFQLVGGVLIFSMIGQMTLGYAGGGLMIPGGLGLYGCLVCWFGFRRRAKRVQIRKDEEALWGSELGKVIDELRIQNPDKSIEWIREKAERQMRGAQ